MAAYLGVTSGAALVLTGIGLAIAKPERAGGWFFTGYVMLWGAEIILFNSIDLVDAVSTILLLERLAFAIILIETLFLVHFIVVFSRQTDQTPVLFSWGTAGYVAIVGGLLAWEPALFSVASGPTDLATVLITMPRFAALYATLGLLATSYLSPSSDIERREHRVVLSALALYAGYTAGFNLMVFSRVYWFDAGTPTLTNLLLTGFFAAATVFLLWLAARLRSVQASREDPIDRAIWLSITVPLVLGLSTGTGEAIDLVRIDLFGLLRLGTALLIAYGLLKFQLFGIDLTVKTSLKRSTIVGAFIAIFFVVSEGLEIVVSGSFGTWAGLVAAGALTAAIRPLEQGAGKVADKIMPGVEPSDDYLDRRRVEVYQAAVERAAEDRVLDEQEREVLDTLADDLDVSQETARRIEQEVFGSSTGVGV